MLPKQPIPNSESSDYESLKESLLFLSTKRFRQFILFCKDEKDYDVRYEKLLSEINLAAREMNNLIKTLYSNIS